ncbi:hypothetical protein L227DRAFT_575760 [Lentinus tigrinus ALCF2SS1-6]|uniref:Uncharacterized protein n=1 Tax=Lentinus tigrinus ALCF2SS1-6 TaxID=1328759 RepID=A0A5C2SEL5_9APHY|nr:hypothetical protein L227DRAFT_575760 [Lentinus tigrinus ALCF2SS1-6]
MHITRSVHRRSKPHSLSSALGVDIAGLAPVQALVSPLVVTVDGTRPASVVINQPSHSQASNGTPLPHPGPHDWPSSSRTHE